MIEKNSLLKHFAQKRLAELGCEQLPPAVASQLITSYMRRAEQRLIRLACREITMPRKGETKPKRGNVYVGLPGVFDGKNGC